MMVASLRTRFLTVFAGFAVVVTAAAGWIATDLIGRAVLREAEAALRLNLQAAEGAIAGLADEWSLLVGVLGGGRRVASALAEPAAASSVAALDAIRREVGFDLLVLTDRDGTVVLRAASPHRSGDRLTEPLVTRALGGAVGAELVWLSHDRLQREGDEVVARVERSATDLLAPAELALLVAAPAHDPGGRVVGAIVAGVVLNGSTVVRERLLALSGGQEPGGGEAAPTVALVVAGAAILSTGPPFPVPSSRPDGQLAMAEDVRRVDHRRLAARDWLTLSAPLVDRSGSVLAELVVGSPGARFVALRRSLMTRYGSLGLAAVTLAMFLALHLAARLAGPVQRLALGARAVAGGDFTVHFPVPLRRDEVGELTAAFNRMTAALADHEASLGVARRELEAANARLVELNHGYVSMLAFVAHELKNVLGTITWSAHALDDGLLGELPAPQRTLTHAIRETVDAALAMSRNYLDLARIESGHLAISPHPCDLGRDVVAPVVAELGAEAEQADMALSSAADVALTVVVDVALMKVVVRNLVGNAIHYGRRGGAIRVSCRRAPGEILCEVWNAGHGLTAAQLGQLFERFRRFDHGADGAPRGSGLGLFLSREIVRRHGGDLTAESVAGCWIRFSVHLPEPPVGESTNDRAGSPEPRPNPPLLL